MINEQTKVILRVICIIMHCKGAKSKKTEFIQLIFI